MMKASLSEKRSNTRPVWIPSGSEFVMQKMVGFRKMALSSFEEAWMTFLLVTHIMRRYVSLWTERTILREWPFIPMTFPMVLTSCSTLIRRRARQHKMCLRKSRMTRIILLAQRLKSVAARVIMTTQMESTLIQ